MSNFKVAIFLFLALIFQTTNGQTILVVTGYNGGFMDTAEAVNMDNVTSCPNIPSEYPLNIGHAVTLRYNSKIVLCGGGDNDFNVISDCYSYSNDHWSPEPFTLEQLAARSVEIRPDEWLVLGGDDANRDKIIVTSLFKDGIFTPGPTMPEASYAGSVTMLNQTHLFVAIGHNGTAHSQQNYFLDVNTYQWTRIPNRLLRSDYGHMSGTFMNSTAGEVQIANVGTYGVQVYSPRDDSWNSDLPFPITRLEFSATVQQGHDSFVLIGGSNVDETGDIFLMDENGFTILEEDVLYIPRELHVAMEVSEDDFTCY